MIASRRLSSRSPHKSKTRLQRAAAALCPLAVLALLVPPLAAQPQTEDRQPAAQSDSANALESPPAASSPADAPAVRDAERRIQFNAAGHPWLELLEWFADEAGTTLTWRELPEGDVNLLTNDRYTIDEAFNLINMHLLPRGFTLVQKSEGLFLVELGESLNPSIVPRVSPAELDRRGPYEYVKVSIPLDWMLAEDAARELAPILSPFGKIIPLRATNRIEAMDAVANLRELRDLVYREQSDGGQERLVAQFHLEHASAFDVANKLRSLLGMETSLGDMSRDQLRAAERQFEYRAQLLDRMGDRAPVRRGSEDVHLVVNERTNSILANASPDKIAIIRQAIPLLDVPHQDEGVRLDELTTMKVYSLNGASADALVDVLEDLREIGKLHPNARFSEDDDRQIIFAYASLQDHLTIRSVRDQLAGSARTFEVIELQKLKAVQVAEQIRAMTEGSSGGGGGGGRRGRGGGSNSGSGWEGFQLQADPRGNRLLLFASPAEMEHVEALLVTLGERPATSSGSSSVRRVQASGESADEILRRLREIWPSMRSNPLRIDAPRDGQSGDPSGALPPTDAPAQTDRSDSRAQAEPSAARVAAREAVLLQPNSGRAGNARAVAMMQTDNAQDDRPQSAQSAPDGDPQEGTANWPYPPQGRIPNQGGLSAPSEPPIIIREDGRGGFILSSQDTEALDELERLLADLMPSSGASYSVFRLEHASPYTVQLRLQEIYASDAAIAMMPLNFVADLNTNSIIVFGANDAELAEIGRLVKFYDEPPRQADPQILRTPRRFDLAHADAERVAGVLKELYRDLLSANDQAFVREDGERGENQAQAVFPSVTGEERRPVFKGMLSVATYPETNSLVVSAPAFLTAEIERVVTALDRPQSAKAVDVIRLSGSVDSAYVASLLNGALSAQQSASTTAQQARGQNRGQNRGGQAQGNRGGRGGRNGRGRGQ